MEKQSLEEDTSIVVEENESSDSDDDLIRIHTEDNNDGC